MGTRATPETQRVCKNPLGLAQEVDGRQRRADCVRVFDLVKSAARGKGEALADADAIIQTTANANASPLRPKEST